MGFTQEQIAKAKTTKSVDDLLSIAKENGIELTEEEAAKYFAELHKVGELSDNELDAVAGGKGEDWDESYVRPREVKGVIYSQEDKHNHCPYCGGQLEVPWTWTTKTDPKGDNYDVYACKICPNTLMFRRYWDGMWTEY